MTTASSTFNAVDGDGYELQMGRWSTLLADPFLDFIGTAGDERILDVGCGAGCLAFALARRCDLLTPQRDARLKVLDAICSKRMLK